MSATTVSNIVASMEALMAQVKELQTDRAAAEERALEAVARAAELRETVATLTQGMHIAALNLGVDNIALESVPSGKVARVQVEALVALCSQAAGAPRVGSSAAPQPAPDEVVEKIRERFDDYNNALTRAADWLVGKGAAQLSEAVKEGKKFIMPILGSAEQMRAYSEVLRRAGIDHDVVGIKHGGHELRVYTTNLE
jgi:pyrroloquinoline quinone (PQQ) biosynthesis protein C